MLCVFDDGDLWEQRPKTLKAFFDPTQAEAMTRERWGASKFVRGQARFGADNEYDEQAEPSDDDWTWATTLPADESVFKTTQYLVDMVKPSFPKGLSKSKS